MSRPTPPTADSEMRPPTPHMVESEMPTPTPPMADSEMRPPTPPMSSGKALHSASTGALGPDAALCCAGVFATRDKGFKKNEPCWVVCMAPPFPDGQLHCKAGAIALFDINNCKCVSAADKVYTPKTGAFHALPKGKNCSKLWRFSRIGQRQAMYSDADAHAVLTFGLGDAIAVSRRNAFWAVTVKLWQEKTFKMALKPRTLLFDTEETARSWATGLKLILGHTAPSLIADDVADDDGGEEGRAGEDAVEARAVATAAAAESGGTVATGNVDARAAATAAVEPRAMATVTASDPNFAVAPQAATTSVSPMADSEMRPPTPPMADHPSLGSATGSEAPDGVATQEIDAIATRARVFAAATAAWQQQATTAPSAAARVAVADARRLLSISPARFARIADALLREEGGLPASSAAVASDAEALAKGQLEECGVAHPPDTRGACTFALTRDGALVCAHGVVCMRRHAIAVWPVLDDQRSFIVDQTGGADTVVVVDSAHRNVEAINAGATRTFRAPDAASAALWLDAFKRGGWSVMSAGAGIGAPPKTLTVYDAVERIVAALAPSYAEFYATTERERRQRAALRVVVTAAAAAQPLAPHGQLRPRTAVLALASLVPIASAGAQGADATVDTLLGMHGAERSSIPFSSIKMLIRTEVVVGNALTAAAHALARIAPSEASTRPVEAAVATMLHVYTTSAMGKTVGIRNAAHFAAWYAAVRGAEFRAEESAWAVRPSQQESTGMARVQHAVVSPTAERFDAGYTALDAFGATSAEANADQEGMRHVRESGLLPEFSVAEKGTKELRATAAQRTSSEHTLLGTDVAQSERVLTPAQRADISIAAAQRHAADAVAEHHRSAAAMRRQEQVQELKRAQLERARVESSVASATAALPQFDVADGVAANYAQASAAAADLDRTDAVYANRTSLALGDNAQPATLYSSASDEPSSPAMRAASSMEVANVARALATSWRRIEEQQRLSATPGASFDAAARANTNVEPSQWRRHEQVEQLVTAERAARFAVALPPEEPAGPASPMHRQRRDLGAPPPAHELDATERLLAEMWGASPSTLARAEEAARGEHLTRTGRHPDTSPKTALQWLESPRGNWDGQLYRAGGASPTLRELAQRDLFYTPATPDALPKIADSTGSDIEHFPGPGDYPAYTHGPSNPPQSGYASRDLRTLTGAKGDPVYGTYGRSDDPFARKWNDVDYQIEEPARLAYNQVRIFYRTCSRARPSAHAGSALASSFFFSATYSFPTHPSLAPGCQRQSHIAGCSAVAPEGLARNAGSRANFLRSARGTRDRFTPLGRGPGAGEITRAAPNVQRFPGEQRRLSVYERAHLSSRIGHRAIGRFGTRQASSRRAVHRGHRVRPDQGGVADNGGGGSAVQGAAERATRGGELCEPQRAASRIARVRHVRHRRARLVALSLSLSLSLSLARACLKD